MYLLGEVFTPISNIISAFLLGLLVDKVLALIKLGSANANDFLPFLALLLGFDAINLILNSSSAFSKRILERKLDFTVRRELQEHLRELGVANLESAEISNKAQRFVEQIPSIQNHMTMSLNIISSVVGIIGTFIFVLANVPQVIPIYLVVLLLGAVVNQKGLRKLWILDRETTERRRSFWNTANYLSDPQSLKELLLTEGYKMLRHKYDEFANFFIGENIKIRKSWLWKLIIARLLQTVSFAIGFWFLLQKTLDGLISVGNLTFQFRMLTGFSSNMNSLFNDFINIRESTIKLVDAKQLLDKYKADVDGTLSLGENKEPDTIEFKDVYFRYPNAKRDVLKGINLVIKPKEKIAIVGENGAGKTTLVKLIARLYKVNQGAISIGGLEINELNIESWYKKLGLLFQDYNTYTNLTLGENITIGDTAKPASDEEIYKALAKSKAEDLHKEYEHGLDQILSERFKDGIRPSTGQWQKIAIARIFYRKAPVLILDEPTASIDAVAEAQIFDNIYKFIENKTVIIISHRFSTVRNADRILVLDKGRIIEEGSHEELLKKKGKYAKAFKLQARGYE